MHTFHRFSNGCLVHSGCNTPITWNVHHSFIRFGPTTYMCEPSTKTKLSSSSNGSKYIGNRQIRYAQMKELNLIQYKLSARNDKVINLHNFHMFRIDCVCVCIYCTWCTFLWLNRWTKQTKEKSSYHLPYMQCIRVQLIHIAIRIREVQHLKEYITWSRCCCDFSCFYAVPLEAVGRPSHSPLRSYDHTLSASFRCLITYSKRFMSMSTRLD